MEYKLAIKKNEVDLYLGMRKDLRDTLFSGERASLI